jgi:hypothetical protein
VSEVVREGSCEESGRERSRAHAVLAFHLDGPPCVLFFLFFYVTRLRSPNEVLRANYFCLVYNSFFVHNFLNFLTKAP